MCYELYENPKYLSCHHSYCEQCLEKMQVESKIMCPECRSESAVPAGGVKDLPADFRIKSMMDKLGIKRREGDEVLKCNECDKDESAVAYCRMCESFFCQFCHEHHKQSKKYRSHGTITVAKLKSSKHVLQACKYQIDLEAIAPVKTVVEDVTETSDAIDEIKKVR